MANSKFSNIIFLVLLNFFIQSIYSFIEIPELQPESFTKLTSKPDTAALVMFYAPWCTHCQVAKPEFFKAASKLANGNSKIVFGLMNCDDNKNADFCSNQQIDGYPTIKYYDDHHNVHYFESEIVENNLLNFIKNPKEYSGANPVNLPTQILLNHTDYLNNNNFDSELSKWKHVLIFYYASWCQHCQESKKEVDNTNIELRKLKDMKMFAVNCDEANSKKLCDSEQIDTFPTVRYYLNGRSFAEYDEEISVSQFLKYLNNPPKKPVTKEDLKNKEGDKLINLMPKVQLLTENTFEEEMKMSKQAMVMFMMPWSPECQNAAEEYNKVAVEVEKRTKNDGSVTIGVINCDHPRTHKICDLEKIVEYPTFIHYKNGKRISEFEKHSFSAAKMIRFLIGGKRDEL